MMFTMPMTNGRRGKLIARPRMPQDHRSISIRCRFSNRQTLEYPAWRARSLARSNLISDLFRGMRVRVNQHGNPGFASELEEFESRVDFFRVLPQAGRVDLEGHVSRWPTILWPARSSAEDLPAGDTQISWPDPGERQNQTARFQCSGRNVSSRAPRFLRPDTL